MECEATLFYACQFILGFCVALHMQAGAFVENEFLSDSKKGGITHFKV